MRLTRRGPFMQWSGPEDFALNALHMQRESQRKGALSIKSPPAPMSGFIAQRAEFAKEMAPQPCAPLHKITDAQLRHLRDWHGTEAAKEKSKSPALANWHERSRGALEKMISEWGGHGPV
jgi:hypothetical protein